MMVRRIALISLALVLLGAGCQRAAQPTPPPQRDEAYVPVVSVTGELVPARWAALSHVTGGRVVEVLVEAGDEVAAGSPLVLLDTADLEFSLQIAQGDADAAQALVDQLVAGTPEQVIVRADRENAQQIAQAEIALRVKQVQLAQAQATDPAIDVDAAQARVAQVEGQIAQLDAQDPGADVRLAQVEVDRATIALQDTRDEYTKALDRPWEPQAVRDGWAKQLEQAELNLRAAQAQRDRALSAQRAHAASADVLEAQLEEARAMLAKAQQGRQAHRVTLAVLTAEVDAAASQLAYLRAWENPYRDQATEQELSQARARLAQAKARVSQIEQQLREATIAAPFGGTVGAVHARLGALVLPGQPLVTIGDLSAMRVETTDLDEIDVVRVAPDQAVSVTFDALPDRVFAGRVVRIAPMAESGGGGVHYTTIIELEEIGPLLRWGMTAFVDIETE